jgi:deazaflavin-dependent oxidoreductase (nitroreductase family)
LKDLLIRLFTDFNAFLIRISRGRIGGRLGTQSILILHTIGRRSGVPRTTPIAYFILEGKYLLVASNWGRTRHPDWYFNLEKQPRADIDVNGKRIAVITRSAEGEEYGRLWDYVTTRHPPYLNYQKMTVRRIPIVILEPVDR